MTTNPIAIIALVSLEAAAVAWAIWEVRSIRKSKTKAPIASEEASRHPEGQHGANDG